MLVFAFFPIDFMLKVKRIFYLQLNFRKIYLYATNHITKIIYFDVFEILL